MQTAAELAHVLSSQPDTNLTFAVFVPTATNANSAYAGRMNALGTSPQTT